MNCRILHFRSSRKWMGSHCWVLFGVRNRNHQILSCSSGAFITSSSI